MSNRELGVSEEVAEASSPIDLVETVVGGSGWPYDRPDDNQIMFQVDSGHSVYHFHLIWTESVQTLALFSWMENKIQAHQRTRLPELLALINTEVTFGHFFFDAEEGRAMFRYSLVLPILGEGSVVQVEASLNAASAEIQRFFPAFQYVLWGGMSPADALAIVLIDPIGTA